MTSAGSPSPGLRVIVEADGGSRGNPGPAGYGAAVLDPDTGATLAERKQSLGIATNNVAEYQGLIAGLTAAHELGATDVRVRMDSKLVVEQMSGRWQVKHPAMRPLAKQANQLAREFARITFEWIPRAQNSHADRLANEAMDSAGAMSEVADLGPTQLEFPSPTAAPTAAAMPASQVAPANNNSAWLPPDSKPTRFILVRHGVTEYSVTKRFAGRSDLDLIGEGIRQAGQAAGRVAALGPVDALVSSPLKRTRQTAQALADRLGLEVTIEDGLIETDFGKWDGYTFEELRQKWSAELERWLSDPAVAPPSGESVDEVTRRVRRARDRILGRHKGQTVAVVSHVSPIKTLVRLALDAPAVALHRMYLAPAAICVIDYFAEGQVSLQSYNDTSHLSAGRADRPPATARR